LTGLFTEFLTLKFIALDQQIIQLLKTKKTDRAHGILYKHFPMMRKMLLANGGTKQDAEDVF
jgi:hypothetical protein